MISSRRSHVGAVVSHGQYLLEKRLNALVVNPYGFFLSTFFKMANLFNRKISVVLLKEIDGKVDLPTAAVEIQESKDPCIPKVVEWKVTENSDCEMANHGKMDPNGQPITFEEASNNGDNSHDSNSEKQAEKSNTDSGKQKQTDKSKTDSGKQKSNIKITFFVKGVKKSVEFSGDIFSSKKETNNAM
jgi:hypothetical protein